MVNAVICEFNPFHNGHAYLLRKAREKTGADKTVCFMSGNFVQRGEPAVCDKHTRAAAAVRQGADLVFQIPTPHTLSNAAVFAGAGVFMASAMGLPVSLCFGSEDEDITPLFRLALTDKIKLAKNFRTNIEKGMSYANAVMQAYTDCGMGDAALLKSPNNLLAFEYIKAIIDQKSDVKAVNIQRVGSTHDSDAFSEGFVSASYIRKNRYTDLSALMPERMPFSLDTDKFEKALLFSLYDKTAADLTAFADMSEGLENRFYNAARTAQSSDALFEAVKSKRYTLAKIRRAAMSVLIGNPKGLCKNDPPFMKVLAFNSKGRELLKTLNQTCSIPIVTKPTEAESISKPFFDLECRASDIFDFCSQTRRGGGTEYRTSPVFIKE